MHLVTLSQRDAKPTSRRWEDLQTLAVVQPRKHSPRGRGNAGVTQYVAHQLHPTLYQWGSMDSCSEG